MCIYGGDHISIMSYPWCVPVEKVSDLRLCTVRADMVIFCGNWAINISPKETCFLHTRPDKQFVTFHNITRDNGPATYCEYDGMVEINIKGKNCKIYPVNHPTFMYKGKAYVIDGEYTVSKLIQDCFGNQKLVMKHQDHAETIIKTLVIIDRIAYFITDHNAIALLDDNVEFLPFINEHNEDIPIRRVRTHMPLKGIMKYKTCSQISLVNGRFVGFYEDKEYEATMRNMAFDILKSAVDMLPQLSMIHKTGATFTATIGCESKMFTDIQLVLDLSKSKINMNEYQDMLYVNTFDTFPSNNYPINLIYRQGNPISLVHCVYRDIVSINSIEPASQEFILCDTWYKEVASGDGVTTQISTVLWTGINEIIKTIGSDKHDTLNFHILGRLMHILILKVRYACDVKPIFFLKWLTPEYYQWFLRQIDDGDSSVSHGMLTDLYDGQITCDDIIPDIENIESLVQYIASTGLNETEITRYRKLSQGFYDQSRVYKVSLHICWLMDSLTNKTTTAKYVFTYDNGVQEKYPDIAKTIESMITDPVAIGRNLTGKRYGAVDFTIYLKNKRDVNAPYPLYSVSVCCHQATIYLPISNDDLRNAIISLEAPDLYMAD